jgi:hypothetical protein
MADASRRNTDASASSLPDAVIVRLESEVPFLRRELESRTEELRRKDHLLAAALERIPELPASTEDVLQDATTAPSRDEQRGATPTHRAATQSAFADARLRQAGVGLAAVVSAAPGPVLEWQRTSSPRR